MRRKWQPIAAGLAARNCAEQRHAEWGRAHGVRYFVTEMSEQPASDTLSTSLSVPAGLDSGANLEAAPVISDPLTVSLLCVVLSHRRNSDADPARRPRSARDARRARYRPWGRPCARGTGLDGRIELAGERWGVVRENVADLGRLLEPGLVSPLASKGGGAGRSARRRPFFSRPGLMAADRIGTANTARPAH